MAKQAFELEKKRQKFAEENDLENLIKLYKHGLPEIKDLNSPNFWDERYSSELNLEHQDSMTKERIKIIKKLIPNKRIKLLDIGAGFGWIEETIKSRKGINLYANDISGESVKNLKKSFNGNFSKQSIYKLNYKKDFFDVILLLEVLEHIPPSKTFGVLKSIHTILKTEGVFIVSVPMNEGLENIKDNPNGHVRMYTKDLIMRELEIAGLKVIEYRTLFAFKNLFFIKTLIARLFHTHEPNNIILKSIKK